VLVGPDGKFTVDKDFLNAQGLEDGNNCAFPSKYYQRHELYNEPLPIEGKKLVYIAPEPRQVSCTRVEEDGGITVHEYCTYKYDFASGTIRSVDEFTTYKNGERVE
jgi:hypothetical protein